MNKLCKILMILVVMITLISAVVFATGETHDKQYLIDYIEDTHAVLNKTDKEDVDGKGLIFIKDSDRENLYKYLEDYQLKEPADIDAIIAKLEEAKSLLRKYYNSNNEASMGLNFLNAKEKAQLLALVREAAAIAGLTVELDTAKEIATFKMVNSPYTEIASANYTNYNDIGAYEQEKPPVDPDDPNKPDDPDDPNKPVDPDDPNKPVDPDDPNKPNGGTGTNTKPTGSSPTGSSNTGATSSKGKLVYTGNDNTVGTKIMIAIVAVAGIGIVGKKYAK